MSNLLKPDINVTYDIPFASPDKVYIRTGVHGDGSCFYHAYLRVVHSQYKYASYEDRCKLVEKLRKHLADQVNNETLINLGKGEPRRMLFFEILSARIRQGFPADDPHGQVLNRLVSLTALLEENTSFKGNFYLTFLEKIEAAARVKIGNDYAKLDKYVKEWIYGLFVSINDELIEKYKQKLLHDQVSALEIEFISKCLQTNFLFLRDVNDQCKQYETGIELNHNWPCVVLLWADECHYEVIGEMQHNRTVKRKFKYTDEFIQNLIGISSS